MHPHPHPHSKNWPKLPPKGLRIFLVVILAIAGCCGRESLLSEEDVKSHLTSFFEPLLGPTGSPLIENLASASLRRSSMEEADGAGEYLNTDRIDLLSSWDRQLDKRRSQSASSRS